MRQVSPPRTVHLVLGLSLAAVVAAPACSDDETEPTGSAGSGSGAASSSSSQSSSSAGAQGGGGAGAAGGEGGTVGGEGGGGGSGGTPPTENCGNGVDDDDNGEIDCEQVPGCEADVACPLTATCAAAAALLPTQTGDTSAGTDDYAASCTGDELAPEQLFTYTAAASGVLSLKLSTPGATDLGLYVRTTCADPASEIACRDGIDDELIDVPVAAGAAVTVFVDGHSAIDAGTFTLESAFTATTEVEPNDAKAQANPGVPGYTATIYPAGDVDWVAVVVPPNVTMLTVETVDLGSGACAANLLDSEVEVLDTDGATSLAKDDDGGDGLCSRATANVAGVGTYYARVSASAVNPGFVFGYELQITTN